MPDDHSNNKTVLETANAAIAQGDYEGFLAFCTEDTEWTYVGDKVLKGKEAVRHSLEESPDGPPQFSVATLIAEGDYVTALGTIMARSDGGELVQHSYCDVWRFRDGKMAGLKAFVIRTGAED